MKQRLSRSSLLLLVLTFVLLTSALFAIRGKALPLLGVTDKTTDRSFSYQGSLEDGGTPANGVYDFQFSLYDQLSGGSQIGTTISKSNVTVGDGLFTVQLNFGYVFDGASRYLEIAVKQDAATTYDTLSPRQSLSPSPYAIHALQAGVVAEPGHSSNVLAYNFGHGASPASLPAILIGSEGFPLIAFINESTNSVMLAHCENLTCSDYQFETLFSGGIDGRISLRLAPDGMPYLTFLPSGGGDFKIRYCQDVNCSQYSGGLVTDAMIEAIAMIGVDGLPIIAYISPANELWALHCLDLLCSTVDATSLIDTDASEPSITVGPDGMPVIVYLSSSGTGTGSFTAVKVVRCDDLLCTETPSSIGGFECAGLDGPSDCATPQITTAHDGDVRVSFIHPGESLSQWRAEVKVINCDWGLDVASDVRCGKTLISEMTETFIKFTPPFDFETAITIRDDNNHLVVFNSPEVYRTWGGDPGPEELIGTGLAVLSGPNHGTLHTIYFLDPAVTETKIAATVGVDGLPIIAYTDGNGELAVIHCGNEMCVPNFREP